MIDVIGLGCACLDFIAMVPYIPDLDNEVRMLESTQQGGGEVATALVALARLGASTTYLGRVGDDAPGHMIKRELEAYGVGTEYLGMEQECESLVSMVLVDKDSGKRTIVAGNSTVSELRPSDIPEGLIESARFLHLDGTSREAALGAAKRARRAGVTTVLDADVLVCDPEIEQLIAVTDILIASVGFSTEFTGTDDPSKAIAFMAEIGPNVVAITMGDRGSLCLANGRKFHTPAFSVPVVDTTGAGDVFHGAFIFGLLRGWTIERTAEFASAVAALKCAHLGGRQGIPTFEETEAFIKTKHTDG
ncbi:MAG: hypothetical protein HOH43_03745 [Candidatus Latescibacteria bacterium]|nr:hypothetical protein [Candidatus Latescibacterota bacterium]